MASEQRRGGGQPGPRPLFRLRSLSKAASDTEGRDPGCTVELRHGRALQLKVEDDAIVMISGVRRDRRESLLVTARLRVPLRSLAAVREALASLEAAPPPVTPS
jgi:hypothetical protein